MSSLKKADMKKAYLLFCEINHEKRKKQLDLKKAFVLLYTLHYYGEVGFFVLRKVTTPCINEIIIHPIL